MKLTELEPQFLRAQDDENFRHVSALDQAQGIHFICPKCGGHSILVWFQHRGVPEELTPRTRWTVAAGTGYDDLTLTPSIALVDGCAWHGSVLGGDVVTS